MPTPNEDPILYDVAIIGGGPAGIAAGVYSARKRLKVLLISDNLSGQSISSDMIRNWIGEKNLTGIQLAQKLEDHIRDYPDEVTIKLGQKISLVESVSCQTHERICDFGLTADNGEKYQAKTVIVCSGSRRRMMGIKGEQTYLSKGVAFCSTCDAPLYKGKKVVVVGGGNAGFEAAHDLLQYASEVSLLDSNQAVRADPLTVEEIQTKHHLKQIILNAQVTEVVGERFVTGLKYIDKASGQEKLLEVDGIFVEIGSIPNSESVKNLVQTNPQGEIMINFQHARTSHPGIFAAGDVTCDPYKQNNIAVGDGVRAALAAYFYLQNRDKVSPADLSLS